MAVQDEEEDDDYMSDAFLNPQYVSPQNSKRIYLFQYNRYLF